VRRTLVLMMVGMLLLAACKSTSSTSAGGSATASTTPITDTRAPGVTADSIKIGIVAIDLSSLESFLHINEGDFEAAYKAIVDDINAHGGIHGRKLDATIVKLNPTSQTEAGAACTRLTQDDKVFVAVGFFLADNVLCYVDTNQTATIGGAMTPARLAKAKAPWYSTDAGENLEVAVVTSLAKAGKLSGKLALLADAGDQELLQDRIAPVLAAAGIKPVEKVIMDAPTNDPTANYTQAATISERLKAEGVNQLLVVGESGPGAFLPGLAKTTYRPQLVFTDLNGLAAYTLNKGSDFSVLKDSLSGGPFGPADARLALGGPTKDCMEVQRAAGLVIKPSSTVPKGQPDQFVASALACQQMYLLEAILQKAGPTLNYGTFAAAGNSLGKVVLPTFPDAWTFGAPPKADGDPRIYLFKWDPTAEQYDVSS
jgi:branched-chain amino acid transport system substrate-binding protein